MKSIDEMRAELEANGYTIRNDTHEVDYKATWRVFAPDEWEYEQQGYRGKNGEQLCKEQAIQKAWAHYQHKKQFQAMREFLGEMAATDFTGTDMRLKGAELWREKAKRLLATLPDSD